MKQSVRWHVLVHELGKLSDYFANVTRVTACTGKFVDNVCRKPVRERIFHVEWVLNFKSGINKLDVNWFTEPVDEFAHSRLCDTLKIPDVGDVEIVPRQLLLLDTCRRSSIYLSLATMACDITTSPLCFCLHENLMKRFFEITVCSLF